MHRLIRLHMACACSQVRCRSLSRRHSRIGPFGVSLPPPISTYLHIRLSSDEEFRVRHYQCAHHVMIPCDVPEEVPFSADRQTCTRKMPRFLDSRFHCCSLFRRRTGFWVEIPEACEALARVLELSLRDHRPGLSKASLAMIRPNIPWTHRTSRTGGCRQPSRCGPGDIVGQAALFVG